MSGRFREMLSQGWEVYANRRMMTLLALGFSSGLPRLLVYSTLSFWLLEVGVSIATVGVFALTSMPYTIKFLWAPLIDRAPLPMFTRALGQRRGWMLATQLALAAAIFCLALADPSASLLVCGACAVLVSIASASQDIVIDAFRVESLEADEQGAGAAVAVFGYRIGMLVAGAGALSMATFTNNWSLVYILMALFGIVGMLATFVAREPAKKNRSAQDALPSNLKEHLKDAVWGPLSDLKRRRGVVAFLTFIMLYKLGDALAGTMLNPLLVELGFTKLEIAAVSKTHGLVASIFGVFLGGWLVKHVGVMRALWIAGFMQMFSNLVFVLQARAGHNLTMLVATIGIENLCGGIGTAAFVAYLSGLCRDRYTATQYALLTAISSGLRMVLSGGAGVAAVWLGWELFFGLTAITAIPGMVMIVLLQRFHATGLEEDESSEDEKLAAVFE
ncbi:MAG: AmpG family muropeptide MFS transporter [Myxococcota bacterium]|nr:AmpG family muropeptide MFS transporter [Myxococcota bacterium]MEC9441036.1 AmpG family muropeptide MFS transporter [Myxococcota bacterium]